MRFNLKIGKIKNLEINKKYKSYYILLESNFEKVIFTIACFGYVCWIITTIADLIIRIIG
jgi:hypothetical protein